MPRKKDVPWKEVARRRMTGEVHVSHETHGSSGPCGPRISVFYEVTEERVVNGEKEVRRVEKSHKVYAADLRHRILAETVASFLPHIEEEVFERIEQEQGLVFEGHDLIPHDHLVAGRLVARALLGKDPF